MQIGEAPTACGALVTIVHVTLANHQVKVNLERFIRSTRAILRRTGAHLLYGIEDKWVFTLQQVNFGAVGRNYLIK